MKKLILLIPSFLILLLCTSCIQSLQLNETAIVQAIGIDWSEEKQFELTLQIYSPKGAGSSTSIDVTKNNASIISAYGPTLASAIRSATMSQGKDIFTGHNRILVIGKDYAQQGIENIFSYFNRDAKTRQNVEVLMAEGTAKEAVSVNIDQGILAAEMIEKMVDNQKENGQVYSCPYYLLSKNMNLYHGSAVMPILSVEKTEENSENGKNEGDESSSDKISEINKLKIERSAVFNEYRYAGELDAAQTRGLLFLQNHIDETLMVAESGQGERESVNVYSCRSRLQPQFHDSDFLFELRIEVLASIDEVLTPVAQNLNEKEIAAIEETCRQKIVKETSMAFQTIVKDYQCDILSLEDYILSGTGRENEPQKTIFYDAIDQIGFTVNVDFSIDRIGMESNEKY